MGNRSHYKSVQCISEKAVRTALDSLLYTSIDKGRSPLEQLLLVDDFLSNPDLPDTPHKREFAIQHILTGLIVDELVSHRQVYGFQAPYDKSTLDAARDAIVQDTSTGNQELIGWSWLYYHYVRVDLNITPTEFSKMALVDRRTLRRYQLHTIKRLTQRLYEMEWEAGKKQRQRRLYAELPIMARIPLFGRKQPLQRVSYMLETLNPCHIQVTGKHGIGKTTFVQEVVRERIDMGQVDHVMWIHQPGSVSAVYQCLAERIGYQSLNKTLRQYLADCRAIIVIDEMSRLLDTPDELVRLLDDLSSAVVFLTNQLYIFLKNVKGHIHLTELSDRASEALIRDMVAKNFHGELATITPEDIAIIQGTAQGHPMAIMEAIHALYYMPEAS